ncbi:MAG: hypothetical protein FD167_6072, partial [bacterium]
MLHRYYYKRQEAFMTFLALSLIVSLI